MRLLQKTIIGLALLPLLNAPLHATDHFVSPGGGNNPPFLSWSDAATNIQDAIDAAVAGDTVWVTNGVYTAGGKVMAGDLTNRVALDKALSVQSVNGPYVTSIQGVGTNAGVAAVRCAWLTNGAMLKGFTLQGGGTRATGDTFDLGSGAGVWCASTNATVANCLIRSNFARYYGGGAYQGTLKNCAVNGNFAPQNGGGAYNAILTSCTVCSNSPSGIARSITGDFTYLTNCIVYGNSPVNSAGSLFKFIFCCISPSATGPGNISADPQFIGDSIHLASTSPCRNAGTNLVSGTDIDGNSWANPPSIGCSEWQPKPVVVDPPALRLTASPLGLSLNAIAAGQSPFTCWWNRDGVPLENDRHYGGAHTTNLTVTGIGPLDVGGYQVIISNAFGMVTSAVTQFAIHYVDPAGAAPVPPFLNWANAATNIQDAIDATPAGDAVWVTNGLYASGGRVMVPDLTNRVALYRPIAVHSVNGPFATIIEGTGATPGPAAVRCAWLTNGAILSGFTLRSGAGRTLSSADLQTGGGVWCASSNSFVENCVIVSNGSPSTSAAAGAYQGVLNSCLLYGNSGRVTIDSFLNNCTIISNSFVVGGALTNCIVYYGNGGFNYSGSTLAYCCTTPLPPGVGNFTNPPQLLPDGFHLANSSPCIGAGTNLASGTDIEGKLWSVPPAVGCSQWQLAPIVASSPRLLITNNPFGFTINASVSGQEPLGYYWYRDGTLLENDGHYSSAHTTNLVARGLLPTDVGSYQLVVSNSLGMFTSAVVQLQLPPFHYVDAASVSPLPPYSTWATAAPTIQDAIDAASPGEIVLVTNGIYASGGKVMAGDLTNRIALDKPITVTSVNGPVVTTLVGGDPYNQLGAQAVRCAWLTNGATLNGFALIWGGTRTVGDANTLQSGGGVWASTTLAVIANCLISNNIAQNHGGGAYQGTFYTCQIRNNQCNLSGGGAFQANLRNCLIFGNTTQTDGAATYFGNIVNCSVLNNTCIATTFFSGAVRDSTAQNCIFYGNLPADFNGSLLNISYSCSVPAYPGLKNISAYPQFLDTYHLAATSPCRGAGVATNAVGTDLDGEAWANPPSMGCDEVLDQALVGPLAPSIGIPWPEAAVGKPFKMQAVVGGHPSRLAWDFGDGSVSNTVTFPSVVHIWTNLGNYTVTLTAFNNDYPSGVFTNLVIPVVPVAQPSIVSMTSPNFGTLLLKITSQPGVSYVLQSTTDLTPPISWQNSSPTYTGFGGVNQIVDFGANTTNRFYRIWAH